jgi:uridylate kinase
MLATMINGMALQSSLEKNNINTRLLSAIKMEQIAESFIRRRAMRHLDKGRVVIFGAGTGNPFFSTDTAAALRAIEIEADLILKGTNVDGIFSDDPKTNKSAKLYNKISYSEVIQKRLKVMDITAFTMCEENKIPIIVFNINNKGNLLNILKGKQIGTLVNFS